MIDFEEELKKFEPSMEVEDAEDAIYNRDLTDMMDILQEMLKESRRQEGTDELLFLWCVPGFYGYLSEL